MKKRVEKSILALIILLLVSSQAFAQLDEELEFLMFMDVLDVTTATLTEKNAIMAPSSMTVISEKEIQSYGSRSILELLQKLPGIIVTKNNYGVYLISLRGVSPTVSSDKVQIQINGHALQEPMWYELMNIYNYPLEHVKQVEIIRGPGSSLYGTNAFAGTINIILKKGEDVNGTEADVKVGKDNTYLANIFHGKEGEDYSYSVNLNYQKSDGPDLTLENDALAGTPFTITPAKMTEGYENLRLSFDYMVNNLTVSGSFSDIEQDIPVGQNFMTQDNEVKSYESHYIEAKYNFEISDQFNITAKASWDQLSFGNKGDFFPDNFVLMLDTDGDGIPEMADTNGDGIPEMWPNGSYFELGYDSDILKTEVLFDYKVSDNNEIIAGVFWEKTENDGVYFKANGHPLYMIAYPQVVDFSDSFNFNKDADRKNYGAFIQDEATLMENLYLVLGLRYDKYDDFGSTTNPRCGLVWDFNNAGGVLKLLYGTAFKAPTFSQLYNTNNPALVGNPDLDAEKIESFEIVLNYIFQEKLQANLSVYWNETEDMIDIADQRDFTKPLAPQYYVNKGETEVFGVELDLRYAFAENSYLFFTYQYTDGEDKLLDTELPFIPESQSTIGLNLQITDNLVWNINADYVGERPREYYDTRSDLDSYTVFDTTLRLNNIAGWDFYFSVYNFTDEDITDPATFAIYPQDDLPRPGITYSVGAKIKFS